MRYLLDEDVNPAVAEIVRGLGLDVASVHEIGRRALSDPEQFAYAAGEGRILITRNRDDFIRLLRAAYASGEACPGILVVPHTLPNRNAPRIAHALKRWHDRQLSHDGPGTTFLDFLH